MSDDDSLGRECVVCLGATGAGKSSTVRVLTGDEGAEVGAGAESVTKGCQGGLLIINTVVRKHLCMYDILEFFCQLCPTLSSSYCFLCSSAVAVVDTPGWSDSRSADGDGDTFAEVLGFLRRRRLTRVRAVLWNVAPGVRATAEAERQAR